MLRDSIKYGPEFADAYSSLASLLAEQVRGMALVLCLRVRALLPQPQHLLHLPPVPRSHVVAGVGPRCLHRLSGCSRDGFCRMGGNSFTVSNYTHMVWL